MVGVGMYYFAYGSNMNFREMKKRCPKAYFVTKAKLYGYKFVYDGYSNYRKCAVGNIVKSDKDFVEGGLFVIDEKCLENLDRYEGYPVHYKRKIVKVIDDQGNSYDAIVYFREPQKIGAPSEEYRAIVLEGAKDCKLSQDYIEKFLMV
jgi:gamma-glutamylcyclotransferase (GGCT)/AIG2-like uncharacterized protein YtfP